MIQTAEGKLYTARGLPLSGDYQKDSGDLLQDSRYPGQTDTKSPVLLRGGDTDTPPYFQRETHPERGGGKSMKETDFYSLSLEEKEEYIRREALPVRKGPLQTLREIREALSPQLERLEYLVSSTLLLETGEETLIRGSIRTLQTSSSRLDSAIKLLEENLQREESGKSNNL